MLEVEDILPSALTPLLLQPPVPKRVCEMQTPALFTMAQSSPQPQSVDTANYARVNPLPSPATSSSSSGELHLYTDSDTSSPAVAIGQTSSSQELLLQGQTQVSQPPPPLSAVNTEHSSQQPTQTTQIPSSADEQSGHSTPETVIPNWAYSGRILGSRPRWQPLMYPPPVMPTPHTQRPPLSSPRYGPTIPPLRPQQPFTQPPPYDRPTSTNNYSCTDPSPRRKPRATAHEAYHVRSSPIQASHSPARHTASPSRGPQPSSSRVKVNPFVPTQGIPHRSQTPKFSLPRVYESPWY